LASRRSALTLLLLGAAATSVVAQGPDTSAFVRVISAETLRKAGVIRLSEVLRLVDDWDAATQDEFFWTVTPAGGPQPGAPRWVVLVDGQRKDLELLGIASLARLPVPLETIDRVELRRTAVLAGGELVTGGVIHFHTRDPQSGLSAAGWATTGSEIGDPGPYAFTPLATPNVDRLGNDGSGRVAFRRGSWFVEAALQVGKQNPTDPAIVDRYAEASRGEDRVQSTLLAPSARAGLRLPTSSHTLSFGHSRARDFLPLAPVAGELAVTERYSQLALDGLFGTTARRSLRYYASWSSNRAAERRSALPIPFAFRLVTLTAGAEASHRGSPGTITAGARVRHLRADAPQAIRVDRLTIGSVYGELGWTRSRLGSPVLAAEISVSEGEAGLAVALRNRGRLGRRSTLDVSVSYARPVHAADNTLWAWTERGYPLVDEAGIGATVAGPLRRPSQLALDLGVRTGLTAWSWVEVEGLWRRHDDLTLAERTLSFNPADRSFAGPADVVTDAGGQVAGGVITAAARAARVAARVGYRYQRAVAGDERFRSAQATIPRHSLRYSLELTPVDGLDLWSMLEYRSATSWREFEPVAAASGGAYQARVPASVGLDVAVQKWLWNQRIRAHLGFRNLLGSTIRYHPAGSALEPRMYVQFEGRGP
jgi:hypothetical protein